MKLAFFVSPHGYGHATRASAVMSAIRQHHPNVYFKVFTTIPHWLFKDSVPGGVEYHEILTDVGLAQKNALHADLPETLRRLDVMMPFSPPLIEHLTEQVQDCQLIVCDIAPLGIAVAKKAGIPSVLVENFTWDWIYQTYAHDYAQIQPHIDYLQNMFTAADVHIQTEPICAVNSARLTAGPVSRAFRQSPAQVRQQLGIRDEAKMVVLTMGGVQWDYSFLQRLKENRHIIVVVAGSDQTSAAASNLILLPRHSDVFHPDLINAADAVVGKVGYSTLAEVYWAGVPFGYLPRPNFKESPVLVEYIEAKMPCVPIAEDDLHNGIWFHKLPVLLEMPRKRRTGQNGAHQIAEFILARLLPTV